MYRFPLARVLARCGILLVHIDRLHITPQPLCSLVPPLGLHNAKPSSTTTTPHSSSICQHNLVPYNKMQVTCQCAFISFPLTAPLLDLYHCHCLECQKQSSSAFGTSAIFSSSSFSIPVEIQSKLSMWTRPTKEGRTMDCYFCKECGCRIYHHIREADGTLRNTVSVKGGVIKGLD
ncbi:Mss4-like protein [Apiosordaria backusii]|uniref:Mss4-like protein n=1 Tax=Apiosordaria backusii TaxID=314023 RepID=A0AA40BLW2_9PEZI|nr:Mss4-like protein [Apiosordaria backusii]